MRGGDDWDSVVAATPGAGGSSTTEADLTRIWRAEPSRAAPVSPPILTAEWNALCAGDNVLDVESLIPRIEAHGGPTGATYDSSGLLEVQVSGQAYSYPETYGLYQCSTHDAGPSP